MTFENEIIDCIMQYNPDAEILNETGIACRTVHVRDKNLAFCLLPIPFDGLQDIPATFFQKQTLDYAAQGVQLVHLWQDCWITKKEIVRSRIAVLSGSFVRIHARQTESWRISRDVMFEFFGTNHLQSFVNGRYNYGLYFDRQLVAAASFSSGRNITRNGVACRSFELLRYANLLNHRVTGGLGKLINRFVKDVKPDDIMTYADLDWAPGKGYQALNFEQIATTPPQSFWIHPDEMRRYYPHRLPWKLTDECRHGNLDDFLRNKGYVKIYNSGNIKYLLSNNVLSSFRPFTPSC
jgi:hypothetical protein